MTTEFKQIIDNHIVELITEEPSLFWVTTKIDAKNNIKVFLDGDSGIAIGQCASVNRKLYKFIEENEFFANNDFSLEVSSPGVDEPLLLHRQYKKNIGRSVEIVLKDGLKVEGKLMDATPEAITIEVTKGKGKKAEITIEAIAIDLIKSTIVQIKF
jgi:ribosome maturation factor RimP